MTDLESTNDEAKHGVVSGTEVEADFLTSSN
jgi:hypothetical protein